MEPVPPAEFFSSLRTVLANADKSECVMHALAATVASIACRLPRVVLKFELGPGECWVVDTSGATPIVAQCQDVPSYGMRAQWILPWIQSWHPRIISDYILFS